MPNETNVPDEQYVYLVVRPADLDGSPGLDNENFAHYLEERGADPSVINHLVKGTSKTRTCLIRVTYPFRREQETMYGAKFITTCPHGYSGPVTPVALISEEQLRNYFQKNGRPDALSVLENVPEEDLKDGEKNT